MKRDFLATAAQFQNITADEALLRGWQRLLAELRKVFFAAVVESGIQTRLQLIFRKQF